MHFYRFCNFLNCQIRYDFYKKNHKLGKRKWRTNQATSMASQCQTKALASASKNEYIFVAEVVV
jgi:hypothetical protein